MDQDSVWKLVEEINSREEDPFLITLNEVSRIVKVVLKEVEKNKNSINELRAQSLATADKYGDLSKEMLKSLENTKEYTSRVLTDTSLVTEKLLEKKFNDINTFKNQLHELKELYKKYESERIGVIDLIGELKNQFGDLETEQTRRFIEMKEETMNQKNDLFQKIEDEGHLSLQYLTSEIEELRKKLKDKCNQCQQLQNTLLVETAPSGPPYGQPVDPDPERPFEDGVVNIFESRKEKRELFMQLNTAINKAKNIIESKAGISEVLSGSDAWKIINNPISDGDRQNDKFVDNYDENKLPEKIETVNAFIIEAVQMSNSPLIIHVLNKMNSGTSALQLKAFQFTFTDVREVLDKVDALYKMENGKADAFENFVDYGEVSTGGKELLQLYQSKLDGAMSKGSQKVCFIMTGASGSGKTYISSLLENKLRKEDLTHQNFYLTMNRDGYERIEAMEIPEHDGSTLLERFQKCINNNNNGHKKMCINQYTPFNLVSSRGARITTADGSQIVDMPGSEDPYTIFENMYPKSFGIGGFLDEKKINLDQGESQRSRMVSQFLRLFLTTKEDPKGNGRGRLYERVISACKNSVWQGFKSPNVNELKLPKDPKPPSLYGKEYRKNHEDSASFDEFIQTFHRQFYLKVAKELNHQPKVNNPLINIRVFSALIMMRIVEGIHINSLNVLTKRVLRGMQDKENFETQMPTFIEKVLEGVEIITFSQLTDSNERRDFIQEMYWDTEVKNGKTLLKPKENPTQFMVVSKGTTLEHLAKDFPSFIRMLNIPVYQLRTMKVSDVIEETLFVFAEVSNNDPSANQDIKSAAERSLKNFIVS